MSLPAILKSPFRLYHYAVVESVLIWRRHGWRGLIQQRGWRFFAAVVAYYLVRDLLLYVAIPFWIARGYF